MLFIGSHQLMQLQSTFQTQKLKTEDFAYQWWLPISISNITSEFSAQFSAEFVCGIYGGRFDEMYGGIEIDSRT